MDLISEVYAKGETLLQTVSDPIKSRLENQLAEFENNWAEFCAAVTDCSNKVKEEVQKQNKSIEFEQFKGGLGEITRKLKHFERLLNDGETPEFNNLGDVSEKLIEIQVGF